MPYSVIENCKEFTICVLLYFDKLLTIINNALLYSKKCLPFVLNKYIEFFICH